MTVSQGRVRVLAQLIAQLPVCAEGARETICSRARRTSAMASHEMGVLSVRESHSQHED